MKLLWTMEMLLKCTMIVNDLEGDISLDYCSSTECYHKSFFTIKLGHFIGQGN